MTTDYSYSMYGPWPSNCGPDMTKETKQATVENRVGMALFLSGYAGLITLLYFHFDPVFAMTLGCFCLVAVGCSMTPPPKEPQND